MLAVGLDHGLRTPGVTVPHFAELFPVVPPLVKTGAARRRWSVIFLRCFRYSAQWPLVFSNC